MMQNTITVDTERTYPVYNPMFDGISNENLYEALCASTVPLDAGLEELQRRLKPIILNAARAFLKALSWTFDNAMGEALICIWDIVRKHSYHAVVGKHGTITGFHTFFARAWSNRLNSLYTKAIMKGPVMAGSIQTGWYAHQPVYWSIMAFDPKAEVYRAKKAAWAAAYYDRKLADQGKTRQPQKPPMTAEEKREKNRIRAAKRFASLSPEQKRAMYDKNNARRKAARDAETPEQKEARRARRANAVKQQTEANIACLKERGCLKMT